jgi:hypothetical protein
VDGPAADGTAALGFGGLGLAGGLWRGALVLMGVAGLLVLAYAGSILAGASFPNPLVFAGYAWLLLAFGLIVWSASVVAAAVGRGQLPRPVLLLGGAVFLLAAALSALSLAATSEPTVVALVLACSLAGALSCAVAWRRARLVLHPS